MDWSFSPYVALHFCTSDPNQYHLDAAIWRIDTEKANDLLPNSLKEILQNWKSNFFTVTSLNEVTTSLREFKKSYEKSDFIIFFEPPSLDQRIINQFALFSMTSNVDMVMDEWLIKHPYIAKKIIIPFKLKWAVRDKLDQSNITERVLFPGLDGMSKWIKRKNSPKGMNDSLIMVVTEIDSYYKRNLSNGTFSTKDYTNIIDRAIAYGAPEYNRGNYDKCTAIYKYSADLLIKHMHKSKIDLTQDWLALKHTLDNEKKFPKNTFVWELRRCFDNIKKHS